jgi:hypothetical protein
MRKLLVLMTTALSSPVAATAASAQAPAAQTPGTQQSPTAQPKAEASDQDVRYHRGMMGRGYGHQEWCRDRAVIGPMMMRIIFSLMDADGDGTVSLQVSGGSRVDLQGHRYRPRWHRYPGGNAEFHARQ